MDESRKQILISAGIDADDALERLMGNESLLERFLKKFLEDENWNEAAALMPDISKAYEKAADAVRRAF